MELHRMVTQPQLTLYISSTVRKPSRTIHGYEYHFITVKPEKFFGLTHLWITKQQAVTVDKAHKKPGRLQLDFSGANRRP
jgi:predicted transcriptional regulator of viral defense system